MEVARIWGGERLNGSVRVSGSKNACLPIIAASLLTSDKCIVHNVPRLLDVMTMVDILRELGAGVSWIGEHDIAIQALKVRADVPYNLAKKMRASICLLGALVARCGRSRMPRPGGCIIGDRPIDLHVKGLKSLGCNVDDGDDYITVIGERLHGASIDLCGQYGSTMTGTMNVIFAALCADGDTEIINAACEPEVVDFCHCLCSMGASIDGIGTSRIIIRGGQKLHGYDYTVIGDRIEAGTFLCAGLMTGGELTISGLEPGLLGVFLTKLLDAGADICEHHNGTLTTRPSCIDGMKIVTGPYPEFPTDLQAQLCSLLMLANTSSIVEERVYPNRFLYVHELNKMGAGILLRENRAHVLPLERQLIGIDVEATDLRACAALYLAGLIADGTTTIHNVKYLDRGYDGFEKKLQSLGARVQRETV